MSIALGQSFCPHFICSFVYNLVLAHFQSLFRCAKATGLHCLLLLGCCQPCCQPPCVNIIPRLLLVCLTAMKIFCQFQFVLNLNFSISNSMFAVDYNILDPCCLVLGFSYYTPVSVKARFYSYTCLPHLCPAFESFTYHNKICENSQRS